MEGDSGPGGAGARARAAESRGDCADERGRALEAGNSIRRGLQRREAAGERGGGGPQSERILGGARLLCELLGQRLDPRPQHGGLGVPAAFRRLHAGVEATVEGSVEGLHLKEFFLLLSSTGLAYRRCELAWVNGDQIGVNFLKQGDKKKAARRAHAEA